MDRLLSGINMDHLSIEQLLRRIGMQQHWKIITQVGYTYEFEHRIIKNVVVQIIAVSEQSAWRKLSQAMGGKQ